MNLDKYIKKGYAILPKTTMTVDGASYEVLHNLSAISDSKELGGYIPEVTGKVMIDSILLPPDYRSWKGKTATMLGLDVRIVTIERGSAVTTLTVQSKSHK